MTNGIVYSSLWKI